MPTLQELKDQIADLQRQADELHRRESGEAIETVKELVAKYGLTAEQIGLGASSRPRGPKPTKAKTTKPSRAGAGVPKYIDPDSGKTWTGFGKPPAWIAEAADRNGFLIASPTGAPRKRPAKKTKVGK